MFNTYCGGGNMKPKIDYGSKFKSIYYTLYSNSNSSRAESIISDLSKVLLYKLILEKNSNYKLKDVTGKDIIRTLSAELSERYCKSESIQLSDKHINFILKELEPVRLSDAPSHIIGEAFQSIIGPRVRGDKGQFFTPEELVNCIVQLVDIKSDSVIMDPACGTGGFLTQAYSFAINQYLKLSNNFSLIGVDKDPDMTDLALTTTTVISKGYSKIYNTNSLEILLEDNLYHNLLGSVDIILTNPPFGSKIGVTDERILKEYDLGHNWSFSKDDNKWYMLDSLVKTQVPQILFLELSIKLLKMGGQMAIVLPEGIFGNKSLGYVWEFLKNNGDVTLLVDCPRNTFQPSTDTKTNVLFFKKGKSFSKEIKVAVAKQCGHDKRGRKYTSENKPWPNDFKAIAEDFKVRHHKWWKNSYLEGNYFVPRYLVGKSIIRDKNNYITIGEMINKGYLIKKSGKEIGSESYGTGNIPYIRTSDINNYEISSDPTNSVSEEIYQQFSKQQNLEEGDILFIADGRYRIGKTAIITKYNKKCLIQSHIEILSLTDCSPFSPYEFLYCLNQEEVQEQIRSLVFIQSTLGTIGNRINELAIPLPLKADSWNKKIHAFQHNIEVRAKCLFNLKQTEHSFTL